ncbi:trypsin-like peptidase domain-containing protein [Nostoc sp. UHCC 0702]|nr:trypsin-like peptidase domain-containing protein [Nostoc sp. UHCC 0702]
MHKVGQIHSPRFRLVTHRLLATFATGMVMLGLGAVKVHSQVTPELGVESLCKLHFEACIEYIDVEKIQSSKVQGKTPQSDTQQSVSGDLSVKQLEELARAITVKVASTETWGSGIIIQRQGQNYLVLTNQHVLVPKEQYRVQTSDGNQHSATVLQSTRFADYDLALLQFQSPNRSYPVASVEIAAIKTGNEVFAAGFPIEAKQQIHQGFAFVNGKVSKLISRAFIGGYQIGNTIDIKQGMSGGPLLNHQGKVVGINGLGKNPAFTNPYIFKDNSTISDAQWQQASQLSWAIPIQTFLQLTFVP